jgi:hypothetical protein
MQIIQWPGHFWPLAEPCIPLGAIAELDRAKIIERTTRGLLHRCAGGDEHGVREDRPRLIPTGRANHYSASPIAGSLYPWIPRMPVARGLLCQPSGSSLTFDARGGCC